MELTTYILPELLILIPVLTIAGGMMKKTARLADSKIPALLGICGMILATVWEVCHFGISAESFFSGVTQGILCAGASVYANQIKKQKEKSEEA